MAPIASSDLAGRAAARQNRQRPWLQQPTTTSATGARAQPCVGRKTSGQSEASTATISTSSTVSRGAGNPGPWIPPKQKKPVKAVKNSKKTKSTTGVGAQSKTALKTTPTVDFGFTDTIPEDWSFDNTSFPKDQIGKSQRALAKEWQDEYRKRARAGAEAALALLADKTPTTTSATGAEAQPCDDIKTPTPIFTTNTATEVRAQPCEVPKTSEPSSKLSSSLLLSSSASRLLLLVFCFWSSSFLG